MALVALAAVFVARERRSRNLMAGLLAGYVAFGLGFTYHIHTHDYYQLAFVPVVGLGVGLTADAAVARIRRSDVSLVIKATSVVASLALVTTAGTAVVRSARPLPASAVDAAIEATERIGELVSHSDKVIVLATAHGWPVRYHGVLAGPGWPYAVQLETPPSSPARTRSASDRLGDLMRGGAEWFVITALDELAQQPELKRLLEERGRLSADGPGYLLYDLRAQE